ncbi:transporter [Micromonospora sp. NPDC050397]|uniref:SLAC1 family transporter n=1 Tax=Micromonospora sp. NPDC050397 TaxID=3364279 RepID=UPI00384E5B26
MTVVSEAKSPAPVGGPSPRQFPLNQFGIAFGLSGLAGTWTAASTALGLDRAAANLLWIVAALTWVISIVHYLIAARTFRRVIDDMAHPVLGPFAALVPTTGMLLGASLDHSAPTAARTVVVVMFVGATLVAALFVTGLLTHTRDIDRLHAGYLLPTVAAGLIGAQSLATVGLHRAAVGSFAVGILMWLLIGAAILARLAFRPALPDALVPTLAILSAPPAVAGNAWFAINGGRVDLFQEALFGTFVLLLLVQFALVRTYARLPFTLGFWALTFTTAASATYGIHWLAETDVPAAGGWEAVVLGAATLLIGWVAARSIIFVRGNRRAARPSHA